MNHITKIYNYKIISIFSLILIFYILSSKLSTYFVFIPVIFWVLSSVAGSIFIRLNYYSKSITKIPGKSNKIAITFDDGPDCEITPQILNLLDKYSQKATFFIVGEKALKFPEIVKEIAEKGHSLGNHSFSHSNYFPLFSVKKIINELITTNNILEQITEKKIKLFRPPFGVTNPNTASAANKIKAISVAWSLRSFDTVKTKNDVYKRIEKVKPGDIILFHDTKSETVKVLDEFLKLCSQKQLISCGLD